MKTVKDGIKFDLGDAGTLGICTCWCGTGSGYDTHYAGWDSGSCACYCSAGAQAQYGCGVVLAP